MFAAKGTITCPASTGNFSVTGLAGTPSVVLFFGTNQTATGFGTNVDQMVGAFIAGPTQRSIGAVQGNASTPGSITESSPLSTSLTINYPAAGGFSAISAAGVTMDAAGFTINFTAVTSGTIIHYLAIGGFTNVALGSISASATGNASVSSLGFQPEAVLFLGNSGGSTDQASMGVAMSSTNRFCNHMGSDGASTEQVNSSQVATKIMNRYITDAASQVGDFVSMDSGGFTVNWTTAGFISTIYLAVKGGFPNIGVDTQKTSTGTKTVSGMSGQPVSVLMSSVNAASSASVATTAPGKYSLGASDGTNHGAIWQQITDAVSTTANQQHTSTSAAIGMRSRTSTTDAEATLSAFTNDGYTLNWTTADATAREYIFFAVGGPLPGPIGKGYGAIHGGSAGIQLGQGVARAANW